MAVDRPKNINLGRPLTVPKTQLGMVPHRPQALTGRLSGTEWGVPKLLGTFVTIPNGNFWCRGKYGKVIERPNPIG